MFKTKFHLPAALALALVFAGSCVGCSSPSSTQEPKKVYTEEFEFDKPDEDKSAIGSSTSNNNSANDRSSE